MSNKDSEELFDRLTDVALQALRRNYVPFLVSLTMVGLAIGIAIAVVETEMAESAARKRALRDLLEANVLAPRETGQVIAVTAALGLLEEQLKRDEGGERLLTEERVDFAAQVENDLRQSLPPEAEVTATQAELVRCGPNRLSLTDRVETGVFVPAQFAYLGMELSPPLPNPNDPIARRQAAHAKSWAPRLKRIAENLNALRDSSYEVIQAYYVSNGGAMANWSFPNTPACEKYAEDDAYSLSERPYMIALRKQGIARPVLTVPLYLDAGGRGMVGTTCVADIPRESGLFRGAACIDYRPRLFQHLPLNKTWEGNLLAAKVVGSGDGIPTFNSRTQVICRNDICNVPLATGAPERSRWLQLTYKASDYMAEIWLILVGAMASLCVAYFWRLTSAWRVAEAQLGMLRDLPAGMLHVERREREESSYVIAASDYAEELLRQDLPSFVFRGTRGANKRDAQIVDFWGAFEPSGFVKGPDGTTWTDNLKTVVTRHRRNSLGSTYWVCLKSRSHSDPDSWLEVIGTPELSSSAENPRSFSLVQRPDKNDLSIALRKAKLL